MQVFVETVDALLEEHRKLVQLLKRKKEVLIQNDIEELKRTVQMEEHQIRAIHLLEQKRLKLGEHIAQKYGIPLENITLSKLLQLTADQPELQSRLVKIDEEFTVVLSLLRGINELNGQLVTQSLQYIQTAIDVLTDTPSGAITYNPKDETKAQKRSLFDSRI